VLTLLSLEFFGTVVRITGAEVDPSIAEVTDVDVRQHDNTRRTGYGQTYFPVLHSLEREIERNPKALIFLFIVAVILLVIGAGYAFTALQLGFAADFAAMSAGVALPEELAKAAAGIAILYLLFRTKDMSVSQFRRCVLAAFGIAGLGFGAGEALKYFGAYSCQGAGILTYAVRAVWCVTLHGSWTLIVGAILSFALPNDPRQLEESAERLFYTTLLACIPSVLAHGLYDACCKHGAMLLWTVGGLSILTAVVLVEAFCDETTTRRGASA